MQSLQIIYLSSFLSIAICAKAMDLKLTKSIFETFKPSHSPESSSSSSSSSSISMRLPLTASQTTSSSEFSITKMNYDNVEEPSQPQMPFTIKEEDLLYLRPPPPLAPVSYHQFPQKQSNFQLIKKPDKKQIKKFQTTSTTIKPSNYLNEQQTRNIFVHNRPPPPPQLPPLYSQFTQYPYIYESVPLEQIRHHTYSNIPTTLSSIPINNNNNNNNPYRFEYPPSIYNEDYQYENFHEINPIPYIENNNFESFSRGGGGGGASPPASPSAPPHLSKATRPIIITQPLISNKYPNSYLKQKPNVEGNSYVNHKHLPKDDNQNDDDDDDPSSAIKSNEENPNNNSNNINNNGGAGGGERIQYQIHGFNGPNSYKFGYDTGKGKNRQFRNEHRKENGDVEGQYGYIDKSGKMHLVKYTSTADEGFLIKE